MYQLEPWLSTSVVFTQLALVLLHNHVPAFPFCRRAPFSRCWRGCTYCWTRDVAELFDRSRCDCPGVFHVLFCFLHFPLQHFSVNFLHYVLYIGNASAYTKFTYIDSHWIGCVVRCYGCVIYRVKPYKSFAKSRGTNSPSFEIVPHLLSQTLSQLYEQCSSYALFDGNFDKNPPKRDSGCCIKPHFCHLPVNYPLFTTHPPPPMLLNIRLIYTANLIEMKFGERQGWQLFGFLVS